MISIIVPCYNGERYVADCVASVKAQTSDDWECVIIDDGSKDNSWSLIQESIAGDDRFRAFRTANRGVAIARNLAISKAKGEYILPLDIDDRLTPDAIEVINEYWGKYPDATLLVPGKYKNYGYRKVAQMRKWRGYKSLLSACSPQNSSCYRKSDWNRIGGYRNGTMYEDWEFWIRLLYGGKRVVNINKVLVDYLVHEDSRWHIAMRDHFGEVKKIMDMNPEIYKIDNDIKDKVLVVIPYFAAGAQGSELTYAVAGWRKHFKEDFLIVVVGDWHPIIDTGDDIMFIDCPRVKDPGEGNYRAHIDHVNKFRMVRNYFPDSEGFIYTCDDIYATRDFTLEDVKKPKVRCRDISGSFHDPNAWVVDDYKTKKVLQKYGLPTMNWVCHLPVYYEWDKLLAIYDKYHCDTKSRVVEQLYFNTYFADSDYVVIEGEEPNDYQFKLFSKKTTVEEFKEAIGKKIWLSNSVKGWRPEMEEILREYYYLKN